MSVDQTTQKLKQQLIEHYADCVMTALRLQGVTVGDGGRFYEELLQLLEQHMVIGDLRT